MFRNHANKRRHHALKKNHTQRLTITPSLKCGIVDRHTDHRPSHNGSHAVQGDDSPRCTKTMSMLATRINNEHHLRTLKKAYTQCTCPLRQDFIKPIGQTLRFTTGLTSNGCPDGTAESRTHYIPLALMDATQRLRYSAVTGVACWWCAHDIEGPVVGCPVTHRRVIDPHTHEKRDGFRFLGYFCSWPCARAYGETHLSNNDNMQQLGQFMYAVLLFIVRKLRKVGLIEENFHPPHVRPAPHFSLLKKFGGSLTIEEFRRQTELDNGKELTVVPDWMPIIPAGMKVTESPCISRSFTDEFNLRVLRDATRRQMVDASSSVPKQSGPSIRYARRSTTKSNTLALIRRQNDRRRHRQNAKSTSEHHNRAIYCNQRPIVNPIQMCLSPSHTVSPTTGSN